MTKATERQKFIMSFCHDRFCRTDGRDDYGWRFIRPVFDFTPGEERLPSKRETRKFIELGWVELIADRSIGTSTVHGVEYIMKRVVLTEAGRAAMESQS